MMNNEYQQGKIYQIRCLETNEVYIGSTITSLNTRLSHHKYSLDCRSKSIIERGNYMIELIEDYPCNTKEELLWRERYYFEHRECVNIYRPITNDIEKKIYYEENKEQRKIYREEHKEQRKIYIEENKDEIKECTKIYREKHKDEIKEYKKKYREENKDELKEYKKIYNEKNKDDINRKRRLRYALKKSNGT